MPEPGNAPSCHECVSKTGGPGGHEGAAGIAKRSAGSRLGAGFEVANGRKSGHMHSMGIRCPSAQYRSVGKTTPDSAAAI